MPFLLNYANLVDPLLRCLRRDIIKISGLRAGQTALDVGCASGAQVFAFAQAGIQACGVDRSRGALVLAERSRLGLSLHNASFLRALGQRLPFRNGCFDGACISLAMHENAAVDIDAAIREMKRVTKPGGCLVLTDFRVPLARGWKPFINLVEFVVGSTNYRNFRDYVSNGGLDGIAGRNGLLVAERDGGSAGIMAVIRAQNGSK